MRKEASYVKALRTNSSQTQTPVRIGFGDECNLLIGGARRASPDLHKDGTRLFAVVAVARAAARGAGSVLFIRERANVTVGAARDVESGGAYDESDCNGLPVEHNFSQTQAVARLDT